MAPLGKFLLPIISPVSGVSKVDIDAYGRVIATHALTAGDLPTFDTSKISDFATAVASIVTNDIGITIQAEDADLNAIAVLSPADGTFIKRSGGIWTAGTLSSGDIPNNAANTSGSAASLSSVLLAAAFPALTGDVTTVAGALSTTLKPSVTIVTPTIASFTNAQHTHQNAAGGGSLDAAAIATGVFNNALVNWASPSDIGGTAAAAASFSLIGVGQAAATYPVEITTTGYTGFIVKKSGSLGFSLSAYYPTLAFNMFYNGSNWVAIGAGPTGMWQQDAITGTMAFSMRTTDATAAENMGSYGSLDRLSITKAGLTSLKATDTATTTVTNVLTVGHFLTTANAGANGLGIGLLFQGADSTSAIGAGVSQGRIRTVWTTATDASRVANMILSVFDTSEHDIITLLPTAIALNTNVGIGTTSPGQLLDLYDGNLRFTQLAAPGAPTAALAGLGAGNVNTGTHSYKVTFVTAAGETQAGTVSNTITTSAGNGQVALSAIPTGAAGTTSRKVYRTVAGNGGSYLLLTTIADNTTTTFADNVADGSLGAAAPSLNTTGGAVFVGTTQAFSFDQSGNTIGLNGSIGSTTPAAGSFTTGSFSSTVTLAAASILLVSSGSALLSRSSNLYTWQNSSSGAGTVMKWTSNTGQTLLTLDGTGALASSAIDTATAAVTNILTIAHVLTTANAGANNIGTGLVFAAADSTSAIGAGVSQGRIRTIWTTATDASRVANMVLSVFNIATEIDAVTISSTGSVTVNTQDSGVSTYATALTVLHEASSGTPSNNMGVVIDLQTDDATVNRRSIAEIRARWTNATDASRNGELSFVLKDNATLRTVLSMQANGSASLIGFLGATPAIQQTGGVATAAATYSSNEQTMLQAVYNALRTFGLLS